MSAEKLKQELLEMAPEVPSSVPVVAVRPSNIDRLQATTQGVLKSIREVSDRGSPRDSWVTRGSRSVVLLAEGARASVYHQSGAIVYKAGIDTAAQPFKTGDDVNHNKALAEKTVASVASGLPLDRWAGDRGKLRPERVWRLMGAGADQQGVVSKPTMFRAVGAYRHHIDDLPVWGPASLSLRVTGDGQLDSLGLQVREPAEEVIDEVEVLSPEQGAEDFLRQLEALMGSSRDRLDEMAKPHWFRFGYLAAGKRKAQRTLEPVYLTQIDVEGEDSQGYVLAAPAGARVYDPICRIGQSAPAVAARKR